MKSPALQSVVECLAVTPYRWYVRADGKLRAQDHGTELCVLTAIARYRTGRTYSIGDWIHAGECIGLSPTAAGLVVEASDRPGASRHGERLRRRLLAAALRAPHPRPARVPASLERAPAGEAWPATTAAA